MGSEALDAGKHVKYKMENTINVIAIKKNVNKFSNHDGVYFITIKNLELYCGYI